MRFNPHSYRVADGHGLKHNPLKAIIAPRPIGWISSRSGEGVDNLAPYSFFAMINDRPPLVMFSSTGWKDSVANIVATGEFVVNMATMTLANSMNVSSASAAGDEFELAGLDKAASDVVAPPRVADSPAALECRMVSSTRLRGIDGQEADAWMVIGEVVAVHLDPRCIVDGQFRTELARPILRAGYATDYWEIGSTGKFAMRRPGQ